MSKWTREFPYPDAMSRPKLLKRRLREPLPDGRKFKMFSWVPSKGHRDGGYWSWGIRGPEVEDFKHSAMYNLPELMWALKNDEDVGWTEGEHDADSFGAVFGMTATSHWQAAANAEPEQVERFAKSKSHIYLVADVDLAGAGCVIHRRDLLLGAGVDADRITLLAPPPKHVDATDAIAAGRIYLDEWVMDKRRLHDCERLAKRYLSKRPKRSRSGDAAAARWGSSDFDIRDWRPTQVNGTRVKKARMNRKG